VKEYFIQISVQVSLQKRIEQTRLSERGYNRLT
jgi:hypothetical protein